MRPRRHHVARRAGRGHHRRATACACTASAREAGRDEHFHPAVGPAARRPGPRRRRRHGALGRPAGAPLARAARRGGGQRRRRPRVLPLPLLPDRARAASGGRARRPASGGPRGAGPAPSPLRRAVRALPRLRLPQPERARARRGALRRGGHAAGPVGLGVEEPAASATASAQAGCGGVRAPSAWRTCPTSSASGGWTTRRAPACCGASSGPTSSATPARSASSSWARWSTRPSRPTTSSSPA